MEMVLNITKWTGKIFINFLCKTIKWTEIFEDVMKTMTRKEISALTEELTWKEEGTTALSLMKISDLGEIRNLTDFMKDMIWETEDLKADIIHMDISILTETENAGILKEDLIWKMKDADTGILDLTGKENLPVAIKSTGWKREDAQKDTVPTMTLNFSITEENNYRPIVNKKILQCEKLFRSIFYISQDF